MPTRIAAKKRGRKKAPKKGAHVTVSPEEPLRIAIEERPVHVQFEGEPEVRFHDQGVEEVRHGAKRPRAPIGWNEYKKRLWAKRTVVRPFLPREFASTPGKWETIAQKQLQSLRTQLMRRQMELKEGRHIAFKEQRPPTRSRLYKLASMPGRLVFGILGISPERLTGSRVLYGSPLNENERTVRKIDLARLNYQLEAMEKRLKLYGDYKKFTEKFHEAFNGTTMEELENANKLIDGYKNHAKIAEAGISRLEQEAKKRIAKLKKIAPEYAGFVFR